MSSRSGKLDLLLRVMSGTHTHTNHYHEDRKGELEAAVAQKKLLGTGKAEGIRFA